MHVITANIIIYVHSYTAVYTPWLDLQIHTLNRSSDGLVYGAMLSFRFSLAFCGPLTLSKSKNLPVEKSGLLGHITIDQLQGTRHILTHHLYVFEFCHVYTRG